MPLSYGEGTIAEHRACRHDAVVFDVSHLGTVRVEGADAFDRLQAALTNDLRQDRARSGPVHPPPRRDGRVGGRRHHRLVGVRRGLRRDAQRLEHRPGGRGIGGEDTTDTRCIIAVQGPHARTRLATVAPDAAAVPRFGVAPFVWEGVPCVAAGTGYTGEDGVECAVPVDAADALWAALLASRHPAGRPRGPGHPPPRGRPAPARPRARTGHHPAAGRAGLGGRLGQARLPGPCRPGRRAGTRGGPPAGRAGHRRPPAPARGIGWSARTAGRPARSPAGTSRPMLEHGIALAFVDTVRGRSRAVDGRRDRAAGTVDPGHRGHHSRSPGRPVGVGR